MASHVGHGDFGHRHTDPWAVLDSLLARLTDTTSSSQAVIAAVSAAREAIGADAAFWYSRSSHKVSALLGVQAFSQTKCAELADRLLHAIESGGDAIRWAADRPGDGPSAAILVAAPRAPGCVVVMNFPPHRPFDEGDTKAVRMALKMLLAQRTQASAGTKEILNGLLHSLTTIIDAKDPYTAGHSERVARIAVLIAKQMAPTAPGGDVFLAGLLHDVGKIGVRDDILQKPGALTGDEFAFIREHPAIGERIVASIKPFERLRPAVRHHHERWDGTGYPDKLAGEAIPIMARVLAVADSCDAMMSARRYRPARTPIDIDRVFAAEAGKQFDPQVVRAFMAIRHEVYPPIYQKGIGESAYHAIEGIVDTFTDGTAIRPADIDRPGSR